MPTKAPIPRAPRPVQVPKLLLRNAHWVDNLCQCECFSADSPGISAASHGPRCSWEYRRDMSQRLGDLLVKEKVITTEQLEQAVKLQKESHSRLASALVKLGFLSDEDVTNFLSRQYGVPAINLSYFEIDPAVVKLIPYETAKRYQILPLSRVGSSLTLAMVDPTNVFAMDDIKFMTGFNIEPVVASEAAILDAIKKQYSSVEDQERIEELEEIVNFTDEVQAESLELEADEDGSLNLAQMEKAAEEAPVIKLVNYILTDAVKRSARSEEQP